VGRGHFGHTRSAKGNKGELKGWAIAFSTIFRLLLSQLISAVKKSTADMRYFFISHSSRIQVKKCKNLMFQMT
jgi:hypothetical protein